MNWNKPIVGWIIGTITFSFWSAFLGNAHNNLLKQMISEHEVIVAESTNKTLEAVIDAIDIHCLSQPELCKNLYLSAKISNLEKRIKEHELN